MDLCRRFLSVFNIWRFQVTKFTFVKWRRNDKYKISIFAFCGLVDTLLLIRIQMSHEIFRICVYNVKKQCKIVTVAMYEELLARKSSCYRRRRLLPEQLPLSTCSRAWVLERTTSRVSLFLLQIRFIIISLSQSILDMACPKVRHSTLVLSISIVVSIFCQQLRRSSLHLTKECPTSRNMKAPCLCII